MSRTFSDKLRNARTDKKLTLEELAEQIGSTKAYVWQLENKPNARPSADLLFRIADALEVAPDFLIDDEMDKPSSSQIDNAFFRKFQKLSDQDKATLKRMIEGLNAKETPRRGK